MYGSAEYLTTEREALLLGSILSALDPSDRSQQSAADRILCDLIEAGLSDADAGPETFSRWADSEPYALTAEEIAAIYCGEEPEED